MPQAEDAPDYDANLQKNQAWIRPGIHTYNTPLDGMQERAFRQWAAENKVPFDANAPVSDYDMRGFWKGLMSGHPQATTAINQNDKQVHFPDFWKTPLDASFSAESQWADPEKAPTWNDKDQLVLPDGTVVFDEKSRVKAGKKVG